MEHEDEIYLGDGCYALFGHYDVRLRAPRGPEGDHVVYLDQQMMVKLLIEAAQQRNGAEMTHKLDDQTAAFVRKNMPRLLEAAMDLRTPAEKQLDRYGVALMMIREGCADPAGLARRVLADFGQ